MPPPAELLLSRKVALMKVTWEAANTMAAWPNDCSPAKVLSCTNMLTPRSVIVLPGSCTFFT